MTKKRAGKVVSSDDLDDRSQVGGEGVDDDFESVALVMGPDGSSVFLPIPPAGMARLGPGAVARVAALQDAVMMRRELLTKMDGVVEELRELGVSWNVIGWSVGTSSQAARQRWS